MGSEERICGKCGNKLEEGVRNCPKCGRLYVDSARDRLGYRDSSTRAPPPPPSAPPVERESVVSEMVTPAEVEPEVTESEPMVPEPIEEPVEPVVQPVSEGDIAWPTTAMAETVSRLGHDEESNIYEERPADVNDVTPEVGDQLSEFAPDIDLLGFDLRAERRGGTWGGVIVRALENPNKDKRCLQYVYLYTRQFTVISAVWMVLVPFLMLIWTFLVPFIFPLEMSYFESALQSGGVMGLLRSPGEAWIPMLATGLVSLPFFVTGFWPHVSEARKGLESRLRFRATTLLIFFGFLMWGVLINELFIWAIIIIWGICLMFWKVRPTGHEMDYIPIFVWIKRKNEEWEFESAVWDYFHYNAEMMSKDELETEGALKDGKNVQLLMDNPWHSLFLGSREVKGELNLITGGIVIFIISLATIVGVFLGDILTGYTWKNWAIIGIMFVFSLSGSIIARFTSPLIKHPDEYTNEGTHLEEEKLRVLWNLGTDDVGRKGRFICIKKIQDPFSTEHDFTTFRDSQE